MDSTILNIITAFGVIVAVFQIAFFIYKYISENMSMKRRDTIRAYDQIYKQMSELKNEFNSISQSKEFKLDAIIRSDDLSSKVMDFLTQIESFAVGIKLGVYTFDVFIDLTSEDLCNNLSSLMKFIEEKRKETNYNKLFNESLDLINKIRYIQECKKQGKKIKRNIYKRIAS